MNVGWVLEEPSKIKRGTVDMSREDNEQQSRDLNTNHTRVFPLFFSLMYSAYSPYIFPHPST